MKAPNQVATSEEVKSNGRGFVVTLVHGTWGRGIFPGLIPRLTSRPRWFEKNSAFRVQLENLLTADGTELITQEFHWSGSNSIQARQVAATALAEKIIKAKTEFPNHTHVIIGHSHGGNVATAALATTGEDAAEWHLISLATPFLSIKGIEPESPVVKKLNWFTNLMYGLLFGEFYQVFLFPILHHSRWSTPTTFEDVFGFFIDLMIVLFLMLLVSGWKNENLDASNKEATTSASVLVLRSIDDEANLVLVVGSFVLDFLTSC